MRASTVRWLLTLAVAVTCLALGRTLLGGAGGAATGAVPTLTLLLVALAVDAWVLCPLAGSLAATGVSLLGLGWAWAAL